MEVSFSTSDLSQELLRLQTYKSQLINAGKKILETLDLPQREQYYTFDLYCLSILNRTLNINRGFISQVNDNNFIAAAPLVRVNLDTLLRLFAAFQTDDIDKFAMKVFNGERIDKIKDRNNRLMNDGYLVNQLINLIPKYAWAKKIYKAGNAFIHLSSSHVFASIKSEKSDNPFLIQGGIREDDEYIKLSEKVWATKAMIQINLAIIELLQDGSTKESPLPIKSDQYI